MLRLFFLIVVFVGLYSCGDSDDKKSVEIADYRMADTSSLLAEVEAQMQGLSIDDFFEQSFLFISQRNDENALGAGFAADFKVEETNLANISDAYLLQTIEIEKKLLDMLESNYNRDQLTPQQQLSYDIYQQHLNYQIERASYIQYSYPATFGLFGWQGGTESFFSEVFIVETEHDANLYIHLLQQVGRRFEQIITKLKAREAQGIIEPSITLSFARDNVQSMANRSPEQTSYYNALASKLASLPNVSGATKTELTKTLKQSVNDIVLPAYAALADEMSRLLAKAPNQIGYGQFNGGDEYYQHRLSYYTSSDMSPQEVHQLGLDELDKIHQQMRTIFEQLGYGTTINIQDAYARVDSDAGIIPAGQVKQTYEELIEKAKTHLPDSFNQIPQQDVIVVGGTSGGYYIPGSDDGSRPGAFYANTSRSIPYTTMPTLAYHEALPGHHLQITLANELDLPLFQRKVRFTSYVEGWGLYAERLAYDLGWYENDPYGNLGRLQFEAMRAARLVIDTGIHTMGWSYDQANSFHLQNVGFDGSIARYSVWPGQATAYSVGMLKILELREYAQNELGETFDIKGFHDVIVGHGSMPLTVLEKLVEQYVTDMKQQ